MTWIGLGQHAAMVVCVVSLVVAGCESGDGGGTTATGGGSEDVTSGGADDDATTEADAGPVGLADAEGGSKDVEDEDDLPWVTEIPEWVDVCDWFEDACAEADVDESGGGGDPAGGGDAGDGAPEDVGPADEGPADVDAPEDADDPDDEADGGAAEDPDAVEPPLEDAAEDVGADVADEMDAGDAEPDTVFSDCDELGIEDAWAGTFVGVIEYDVETGGLFTPEEGKLSVGGELTFGIECIDSKLVVDGTLEGFATVQGQGDFPFSIALNGYYNPVDQSLSASMGDGVVSIYGLIEVYFIGEFTGQVNADGDFDGDWTASATGTNQAFVTGDAEGEGTWSAQPTF